MGVKTGGLMRRSIGPGSLWVFAVAASSPMTVIAGGVPVTYATTGVAGVPLSFLVLMAALAFLTVGYVAMARWIPHAATAYALLARLSPTVAVGGAAVALLGYNCMEIGLFGLMGGQLAAVFEAVPVLNLWWVWAGVACLLIAYLGPRRVHHNVRVVAFVLVLELGVIAALILAGTFHPADGHLTAGPLTFGQLAVDGVGGVLAFSFAANVGYESGPVFSEEARGEHSVARATFNALVFIGLLYTAASWAMAMAVGPDHIIEASGNSLAPGAKPLPVAILSDIYTQQLGPWVGKVIGGAATALFFTSMFGAMLSFHGSVARYLFALGREQVAPSWLARVATGRHSGAPMAGSLAQSALAATTIAVFAVWQLDPVGVLFTWLSAIGALSILAVLIGCSVAAMSYFRHGGGGDESLWERVIAPSIGIGAGAAVLGTAMGNLDKLLSLQPDSPWILRPLVILIIAAALAVGLAWGRVLRKRRRSVYDQIGQGTPPSWAVLDPRLADIKI